MALAASSSSSGGYGVPGDLSLLAAMAASSAASGGYGALGDLSLPGLFEANACLVAQAGFRVQAAAYGNLSEALRLDERLWRGISRLYHGLHRRTRLAFAARCGDVERCAFLVAHGALVNVRDGFGRSPLTEALAGGHAACAAWLRGAGAEEDVPWVGAWVATWGPEVDAAGAVDSVRALAVCGDGLVAVGHCSGTIMLRNAATGAVTATLRGHGSEVYALAPLPLGRLASCSHDGSVRVWRVATGVCEAVLAGHTGPVLSLVVLLDGRIASGAADCTLRLWHPKTLTCTTVLAHKRPVSALAALPRGGVASGGYSGRITLWSAAGKRLTTLGGGAGFGYVLALAVLHDGRLAAGYSNAPFTDGGGPSVVRVWDLRSRTLDSVFTGHADWVMSLAELPDGRLVSGSHDHAAKVWGGGALGARGGAVVGVCAATLAGVAGGHTGSVTALGVLPLGGLISASGDGTVRVWG